MPAETALAFLRALEGARPVAPVIVIAGPQAFLREYVLDAVARRLAREGFGYCPLQVTNAAEASRAAEEVNATDLFAPRRLVACRVARSVRARGPEEGGAPDCGREGGGGYDAALLDASGGERGPNRLVIVYERDAAPAKARHAAENAGVVVNCLRPFDNQLPQYAALFARRLGLKLSAAVAEVIVSRHGGDLAAIANTLAKAAISLEPGAPVEASGLSDPGAERMPELFAIAESLSTARPAAALEQLLLAVGYGREPVEILSVEIVPAIRRMMLAAALLDARKGAGEIAAALGFNPASSLVTRAIEGAKRLGAECLGQAYRRAAELDAGFKSGRIKGRAQALAALILEFGASQA